MSSTERLPLAAAALLLMTLYVCFSAVLCRVWRYLIQKNSARDPVEPRWTLALIDKLTGEQHNLDLDQHKFDFSSKNYFALSLRTLIEKVVSNGAYLGAYEAHNRIRTLQRPIVDFDLTKSAFGHLQLFDAPAKKRKHKAQAQEARAKLGLPAEPDDDAEKARWKLAPLKVLRGTAEVVFDINPLRTQIDAIAETLLRGISNASEAQRRIDSLSIAVVDLQPGESCVHQTQGWAPKLIKSCCCNRVAEANVRKDFTSHQYTKGESEHKGCIGRLWKRLHPSSPNSSPGKNLPWIVTSLTTFIGSLLLFITWAAFYPGVIIDSVETRAASSSCHISTSGDGLCTVERIAHDVSDIVNRVRAIVNYNEASQQLAELNSHKAEMEATIANYSCLLPPGVLPGANDDIVSSPIPGSNNGLGGELIQLTAVNLSFPDWCGNRRQEEIDIRRLCCTSFATTLTNMCGDFSGAVDVGSVFSGFVTYFADVNVCFSDFPGWSSDLEIGGWSQTGCDGWGQGGYGLEPCPMSPPGQTNIAIASEQTALSTYLENKAIRYSEEEQTRDKEALEGVTDNFSAVLSKMARDIKRRVDIASDYYIAYCILRLWFPSPLLICSSPWQVAVRRTIFGMSRNNFVIVVIILWWFLDMSEYVKDLAGPNLLQYLSNIAVEPCFLDSDYLTERVEAINAVCSELQNMSYSVLWANRTVFNVYTDAEAWSVDPLPYGCSCDYPGNISNIHYAGNTGPYANNSGLRPFVGNLSFCLDEDAQRAMLNPPQPEVSWWTVWFKSGVVAELMLKVTLVNFCYGIIGYTNPLGFVGGSYEVHRKSQPLPMQAQDEIAMLLGHQHLRDTVVWGFVALVATINLGWNGILDVNEADDADISTDTDAGANINVTSTGDSVSAQGEEDSLCLEDTDTDDDIEKTFLFLAVAVVSALASFAVIRAINREEAKVVSKQKIVKMMRDAVKMTPPPLPSAHWQRLQERTLGRKHQQDHTQRNPTIEAQGPTQATRSRPAAERGTTPERQRARSGSRNAPPALDAQRSGTPERKALPPRPKTRVPTSLVAAARTEHEQANAMEIEAAALPALRSSRRELPTLAASTSSHSSRQLPSLVPQGPRALPSIKSAPPRQPNTAQLQAVLLEHFTNNPTIGLDAQQREEYCEIVREETDIEALIQVCEQEGVLMSSGLAAPGQGSER